MSLPGPPQRQPSRSPVKEKVKAPQRTSALKNKEEKKSMSRSRSPLRRHVQFVEPVDQGTSATGEDMNQGMRMKDARDAVPRREGESRQQWKNRVFNYKRQEEAKKEGAKVAPKAKK